jgi:fatty acid desaturase/nitrite reductase/ring-hydroxylating ferredoxin subunit
MSPATVTDPTPQASPRDYRLTGEESKRAIEAGLAEAHWYRPPIDADRLQALMARTNGRAARDVTLWLVLLVLFGVLAYLSLGSWWAIPAFAIYGTLYGGAADSRWHECGHGTAFRTPRINDVVYYLASFMLLREPTMWRWSHFRHHSDTIIVGRDPEILFTRPFRLRMVIPNLLQLENGPKALWRMARHAAGSIDDEARDFVPEDEQRRIVWEARAFLAVLAGVVVWSLSIMSIVPLLFIGLPTFYGAWLLWFFAATQHAGLREDVLDHRLNSRTVYMNPVFRFLYLNMNYHLEHHLFPSVPYHALPALHAELRDHLPPPKPNVLAAYREIIDALRHQRRDATWEIADLGLPADEGSSVATPDGARVEVAGAARVAGREDLGPADVLQPGQVLRVDLHGATYALCRPSTDTYSLVDGLCTHGQTHLADGLLIDGCIECPKHNGRFDVVTGEPVRRPARVPLGTHPVEVVDGRLLADLASDTGAAVRSETTT